MEVQSALSLYDIQSRVPNLITFFEKLVRGVKIIPDIRANMTGISINVMEDCPFSSNKMIRPEYSVGNEVYLFKDEPLGSLQESLIRPHDVFDYRNLAFEIRHVEKVMAP